MQIIGPDGQPIESPEQLAVAQAMQQQQALLQQQQALHQQQQVTAPPQQLEAPQAPVIPTRAPSTTIDKLEQEFQKKKARELELSRQAGAATASPAAQRATGQKVGRNDKCPCGSGKKYKVCHGVNA